MSVIVEFSLPAEEFTLGQIARAAPNMRFELERIVPTDSAVLPFFWATGEEFETLERALADHPDVQEFTALDRVDDGVLYRVEWRRHGGLVEGIAESGAVVLQAQGNGGWTFRLRFTDHDAVAAFYNYCTDHDIDIHVDRVYTLTEDTRRTKAFELTPEQREALVLALRRGYFDTPSESSLGDIAAELGISQQALSKRVRRGNEKVLRKALLTSAEDLPRP